MVFDLFHGLFHGLDLFMHWSKFHFTISNSSMFRRSIGLSIGPLLRPVTRLNVPRTVLKLNTRSIVSVQPVKKRSKLPLYFIGAVVLGTYGYWKYITHHNYPPTVADLLKEGLLATINGAGPRKPDYRKAFMKYVEALQEADRLRMDPTSDEYTGIQIIIASMYERLNLLPEAAAMYAEIGNTYLIALAKDKIPHKQRDRIITRDLRVILMAATLMSTDPNTFKQAVELVRPHLVMATREAVKNSEELRSLFEEQMSFSPDILDDVKAHRLPDTLLSDSWGSYKHEIVAMRDLMTGIATASGEYMQALMVKTKTTEIMLTSGFSTGECMLSAANVASLLYLQSINLKLNHNVNQNANQNSNHKDKFENNGFSSAHNNKSNFDEIISRNSSTKSKAEEFLDLSEEFYTKIVDTIDSLNTNRTDLIPEAYIMSLYGKGVIKASKGDYAQASELLNEAKLRARGSEMDKLLAACEGEIAKLDKLKDMTPEEVKDLPTAELPTIDIMFWKLAPEIDDSDRPVLPEIQF